MDESVLLALTLVLHGHQPGFAIAAPPHIFANRTNHPASTLTTYLGTTLLLPVSALDDERVYPRFVQKFELVSNAFIRAAGNEKLDIGDLGRTLP